MTKRIQITPEIAKQIRLSIGDEGLDVSGFVVFEARALTTEAIKKPGFYDGARVSGGTLKAMADTINKPGGAIHLQVMHENDLLPVGRVFSAAVLEMGNGEVELRALFYLPEDKKDLVKDIEAAVIDEVSVGLLTESAICSECNFDYFGDDATFENFYTLTCANDHQIGTDGCHIRLVGVKDFAELSLVNRGAASNAKILSKAKQVLSQNTMEKLAASGSMPVDSRVLSVNTKLEASVNNQSTKGTDMDLKEFTAALQAKTNEVAEGAVALKAATEKATALEAQVTALTGEVAELKKAQGTENADLATKATEAETKLSAAFEKLLPHAKAALIASGVAEADLPKDVVALATLVEEKGLKLHQVVGSDAKSLAAKSDVDSKDEDFRKVAFKTVR